MTALQLIPLTTISGDATDLGNFAGKVLLIVNVASKCGLTPQYEGLEKLYEQHRANGLEVLGFPANNFGAQEPGTDAEIVEFCSTNFLWRSRCSRKSAWSVTISIRCTQR